MNFVVTLSKKFAEPLVVQTEIKDYLTGMKVERNAFARPTRVWFYSSEVLVLHVLTPCPDQNS